MFRSGEHLRGSRKCQALSCMSSRCTLAVSSEHSQTQCEDISSRCVDLMVSLRDSAAGLEGQRPMELVDEINQ